MAKSRKIRSERVHFSRQEYAEYLLTDEWAKKRDTIIKISGGVCAFCKTNAATEVHHLTYRNITDVTRSDLRAACHACHGKIHALVKRRKISLSRWEHGSVLFAWTMMALNAPPADRTRKVIGPDLARKIISSPFARRVYGLLKYTPRTEEDLASATVSAAKLDQIVSWVQTRIRYAPQSKRPWKTTCII